MYPSGRDRIVVGDDVTITQKILAIIFGLLTITSVALSCVAAWYKHKFDSAVASSSQINAELKTCKDIIERQNHDIERWMKAANATKENVAKHIKASGDISNKTETSVRAILVGDPPSSNKLDYIIMASSK